MSAAIRFYNPRTAAPELLAAMFVGRHTLLEELQSDLARQSRSETRQHWLIRGARGMGKTHLVGLLYHRVLQDQELSRRYLPIWLSETDAYEVYSAGTLLVTIANRLTEELGGATSPDGSKLARQLAEIEREGDDPALFQELTGLLKSTAKARDRVLLVLMENLDAMLAGFPSRRNAQEARKLRSLLSHEKELLFVSTTPTRYLADLSDPEAPLYGHLRERNLTPLSEAEVGELLERLVVVTASDQSRNLLGDDTERALRRRVLHRLTGGNPRAVVMAFKVLSGSRGIEAIVEEFEALLDLQTGYFEARLARLAPRERVIVTALSLAEENLTLKEIAAVTRLPERSLSTQVDRLVEEGHVAPASGGGGKGTIYEVTDGLFRLWYQYRKGRTLLLPLVRFLALWHPTTELETTLRALESETSSRELPLAAKDILRSTLAQVREALSYGLSERGKAEREAIWSECERAARGPATREVPQQEQDELSAALAVGDSLRRSGKLDDAAGAYQKAIDTYEGRKQPALQSLVASAMVGLGLTMGQMGRQEEETVAYRQIIHRYGTSDSVELQDLVSRVMVFLGITLRQMGQAEAAVAIYRQAIERYGSSDRAELQSQVAAAAVGLGMALGEAGRPDEEIATYRHIVERYGASDATQLRNQAAWAMLFLGMALGQTGQAEAAVTTYQRLVERYGTSGSVELRDVVARAMVQLAFTLGQMGQHEAAVSTFRQVIERYGTSDRAQLQDLVADAMVSLGETLGQMGQHEAAVSTRRQVIERYGASDRPELQRHVARAMINVGSSLGEMGQPEAAITAYRRVVERYGTSDRPELQRQVARAMLGVGIQLAVMKSVDEAAVAFGQVFERFNKNERPEVRQVVAAALACRGMTLFSLGKATEAEAILSDWTNRVARFTDSSELNLDLVLTPLLTFIPSGTVRKWLDVLAGAQSTDVRQTARLHRHVLDVVEGSEGGTGAARGKAFAERRRRALGRVPPELRQTVEEIANQIAAKRRKHRSASGRRKE